MHALVSYAPRSGEIGPIRREIVFEPLPEPGHPLEPPPADPARPPEPEPAEA